MQRTHKMIVLVSLYILFQIVSCQTVNMNSNKTSPVETLVMNASTLTSLPTPLSIFDYQDQVTDEKLLLSIELLRTICYKPGDKIEIVFTFRNLSQDVLVFQSNLDFATGRSGNGGNLAPFIFTDNGGDVLTAGDYPFVDVFGSPPKTFTKISPGDEIELTANYSFPELVFIVSSTSRDAIAPPSGKYIISFIYMEYDTDESIWRGQIRSNQIGLCILGD